MGNNIKFPIGRFYMPKGKCTLCSAVGWIECPVCYGNKIWQGKVCDECNGRGLITCTLCDGTGVIEYGE